MDKHSTIEGIIIDFDGTLAGVSHKVSPRVKAVIEEAREKVKISLCTGRPYQFVAALARDLGLHTLHVADGGGRVVDQEGNIHWERFIDPHTVMRMSQHAEAEGMRIVAQIGGDDVVGWPPPPEAALLPPITHILFQCREREKAEMLLKRMKHEFKDVHCVLSHYQEGHTIFWMADVTAQGANKQHALLHLAQLEGLDLKNFMAIGDGYNDFPLLLACGFKVAMGNASKDLKEIADYVAPSVEEDGVAEVIERFVLKPQTPISMPNNGSTSSP